MKRTPTKSFKVAIARSGWPNLEAVVAAPLGVLNQRQLFSSVNSNKPLIQAIESCVYCASGADTIADSGCDLRSINMETIKLKESTNVRLFRDEQASDEDESPGLRIAAHRDSSRDLDEHCSRSHTLRGYL